MINQSQEFQMQNEPLACGPQTIELSWFITLDECDATTGDAKYRVVINCASFAGIPISQGHTGFFKIVINEQGVPTYEQIPNDPRAQNGSLLRNDFEWTGVDGQGAEGPCINSIEDFLDLFRYSSNTEYVP